MINPSPVEQVKAAVDVVHLLSQYLNLKKSGRTYKALCPFHTEKTPSFVVFPETGRWHCFGCGEGGDLFTFVMKMENLTFPEALRHLAESAGIPLAPSRARPEDREAKQRLYAANEAAAVYYHGVLVRSSPARDYVAQRGITDESIRRFLLGLAPDAEDALQRHLLHQGFSREELLSAGLLYEAEGGPVRDRYRGRLLFPVRDSQSRIVSFGARALSPDAQPKYLNGPQTEIFDKGGTLFGLHAAAQAIRREHRVVVVEGYIDVVIAHQAGFENVVATLGTSITDRQLREAGRLAPEICLALDPDPAGQTAALRGAQVAGEAVPGITLQNWRSLVGFDRISVSIAVLPEGKDPDELILEDPEQWRSAIASARPVVEQALEWMIALHDVHTLQGKREAVGVVAPLLGEIADPIGRSNYVELAAQRLRVDPKALAERVRAIRKPSLRSHPSREEPDPQRPPAKTGHWRAQAYALCLAVEAAQRGLAPHDFDPRDFTDASMRALLLRIQEIWQQEAHADWRPDLLGFVKEPWLEGTVLAVGEPLSGLERLTDAEISSEAAAVAQELWECREATELEELRAMAEDPALEDASGLKDLIAQKARSRAPTAGRSADGTGRVRGPAIPWKFRTPEGQLGG